MLVRKVRGHVCHLPSEFQYVCGDVVRCRACFQRWRLIPSEKWSGYVWARITWWQYWLGL